MKKKWIRLYTTVPSDPKIQMLPDPLFRFWVNCLCIAGLHEGWLPTEQSLAFSLRLPDDFVVDSLAQLKAKALIHHIGGKRWKIHDWQEYQYDSDNSTERVQRYRKRQGNVSGNVSETAQKQSRAEADTESIDQASTIPALAEKLRMDRPSPRSLAAAAVLAATPTELTDPGLAACALALELVPRDHKQRRQCELVLMEASERIAHAEAPRKYAESIVRDLLRRA